MEAKQKYEQALRTVAKLSRVQRRLFADTVLCVERAGAGLEALGKIKLETEGQLQDLQKTRENELLRKLNRVYFLTDMAAQKDYFLVEILPLRPQLPAESELEKEFLRAKAFVISNAIEHFLDSLEGGFDTVRQTNRFLTLDRFLKSQDTTDHVKGGLAIVFDKFVQTLNEQLADRVPNITALLETYNTDLACVFADPEELRTELCLHFFNYIRATLLGSLVFKFSNKSDHFVDRIEALWSFLADARTHYPSLARQAEKCEKAMFLRLKDFILDYFDKYDMVLTIDRKFDFLAAVFKAYDPKALKIWLVDLIDSHVDSTHNRDSDLFGKYALIHRLEKVTFRSIEKFMKAYLRKKLENFMKEQCAGCTRLETVELKERPAAGGELPAPRIAAFYKDYFRRFLDHVNKVVVPAVRACVIKDSDLKTAYYNVCIKAVLAVYHKELSAFLTLELPGVEKKQCFELYANDLEEQIREDLFGF